MTIMTAWELIATGTIALSAGATVAMVGWCYRAYRIRRGDVPPQATYVLYG